MRESSLDEAAVAGAGLVSGVCSGWASGFHTRFVKDWLFVQRWLECFGNLDHVPVGGSPNDCSVSGDWPVTSIVVVGFPVPTLIEGHDISAVLGGWGLATGACMMSGPGKGVPLTPV